VVRRSAVLQHRRAPLDYRARSATKQCIFEVMYGNVCQGLSELNHESREANQDRFILHARPGCGAHQAVRCNAGAQGRVSARGLGRSFEEVPLKRSRFGPVTPEQEIVRFESCPTEAAPSDQFPLKNIRQSNLCAVDLYGFIVLVSRWIRSVQEWDSSKGLA
jgi:hypothetical protein